MRQFIIGCIAGGIIYILNYVYHKSSTEIANSKKD